MRQFCIFFLFVLFAANTPNAQTVTLKQIGTETIMFSTRIVEQYNHYLYTIDNTNALYKTDLSTGTHARLGNVVYKNTRYLFAVNNQLYCMETDGSMNRIDINTGAWTVVSPIGTWRDIERVIVVGRNFYTTHNGVLYHHPAMSEKGKKQIGEADFYDLGHYCNTDTTLYSMIGGSLYNIDLATGKWKMIGSKKGWKFAKDNEVIGNKLYTIETPSSLFETDLATGTKKELDNTQFKNAELIFADSGKLYGIFNGGLLYEIVISQ